MVKRDLAARIERLAASAGSVERGPSKVTTLEDAVRRHVKPGMHLHLVSGLTRPIAPLYEIMRRFRGRRPGFTLSTMTFAGPATLAVHEGLVNELICTFHGDTLPTPGPNPLLQQAFASERLRISAWSILTFTQRLLAGALRLPWIPTNSLRGSDMEQGPDVAELDGSLVVKALNPDLTFVHAAATDPFGNALVGGPLGDECLGAWAARGTIVTAERIVPPEVIAAHSSHMVVPAGLVRAVVEAPFGAHPGPLYCGGVEELVAPIAEDVDFVVEFRDACRDPAATEAWTKAWVYDGGHGDYLARLGGERLSRLRGRAQLASWREDALERAQAIFRADAPSEAERAVVAGARALGERMREKGLTTVLAGVGMSNIAAWVARARLAEAGVPVALMVELGLFDYVPPPADPLLVSNRVAATAAGLGGVLDILGLGLIGTPSAGVVGAGQIDRGGNINSSRTSDGRLLVGSGGVNDVASICRDVVVVCTQDKRRFVERVPYVTAPGARVGLVATQHGTLEPDERGELVLTAVYGNLREGVSRARRACGWRLKVADRVKRLPEPTRAELELVRAFDPDGLYTA